MGRLGLVARFAPRRGRMGGIRRRRSGIVGVMCRLLGWATRTPTSLHDLLGSADLDAFTELSC